MNDQQQPQRPAPETNVLIDRARIRGASRLIAQGANPKDVTPEQVGIVADDVRTFCKANGVSQKEVATAIGFSAGVISDFLNGSYKGNVGQLAIDLDEWLLEEEQRRTSTSDTEFVYTKVVETIESAAYYCLDHRKVGLVYGPESSGFGKTKAFTWLAQKIGPRRCSLITIDKCDANPTGLLRKISASLRLENTGSGSQKTHRIIEALSGRSHILLVDQIHNLRYAKEDRPFYYLMDIHDNAKTAQLWAGTSDLVSYFQRQRAKTLDEPLAQIRSRIAIQKDLSTICGGPEDGGPPLYTVDDIRQMFSKSKLRLTSAASRWLCTLARIEGSGALRTAVNLVEFATVAARQSGAKEVDVIHLRQAMQWVLTPQACQAFGGRLSRPALEEKAKVA